MRVLHICWGFPPTALDGAAIAVDRLCAGLAASGVEVGAISIEPPRRAPGASPSGRAEITPSGIRLLRLSDERDLEPALDIARRRPPAIVHSHYYRSLDLVEAIAGETGAAVVESLHELYVDEDGQPRRAADLRGQAAALARADRVVLHSGGAAARLARHEPEAAARAVVIGHGLVDTPEARAAAYRRRPRSTATVLYCGRVSRQKGVNLLLEAVPAVLESVPKSRFLLVGLQDPPRQQRMVARWLEGLAPEVARRVAVRGWLEPAALAEVYARADVVVVPSRNDSFGLVTLEAMLHGCAVVATRTDGSEELLENGRTGLLVPAGDARALAAAAVQVLTDRALAGRLGRAAADDARASRSQEETTRRTLALYRELAAAGSAAKKRSTTRPSSR